MNRLFLLLVEDNEGDILLTEEAFEERNLVQEIAVARDGEEAINFLKNAITIDKLPNLILLDVNLPKVNGHEVLAFIKTADEFKHIPVLMLTTSSAPSDILKAYQNYVNGYITKPVDTDAFLSIVNDIEDFWIRTVKLP
jgi:CheY-like chemotaxis protein